MSSRVSASALCEVLPWDSEFFHCRIGRVRGDTLNEEQASEIEGWCRIERIRGLYFLARAGCPITIQTAQNHGFGLVDIRVTFERRMLDSRDVADPKPPPGANIHPVRSEDLPALQAIARTAHGDTRFFSDPHFPRGLAEAL